MTLIQINKPLDRESLANKFGVEFPLSDWVSAKLSEDNHVEANRYDITKKDFDGDTWSVYLYMDEDSTTVIAIDDTARNATRGEWYDWTLNSPFDELFDFLKEPVHADKLTVITALDWTAGDNGVHLYYENNQALVLRNHHETKWISMVKKGGGFTVTELPASDTANEQILAVEHFLSKEEI